MQIVKDPLQDTAMVGAIWYEELCLRKRRCNDKGKADLYLWG